MPTINDINRFISCRMCAEANEEYPLWAGLTPHNEIVVGCEKHGLIVALDVVVPESVQVMKCGVCGKSFDQDKPHTH